jgi:hypothetical protein
MSSISLNASSVLKSPAADVISEEQRQCTQCRLHCWVVSQAIHFGIYSFVPVMQAPLAGEAEKTVYGSYRCRVLIMSLPGTRANIRHFIERLPTFAAPLKFYRLFASLSGAY